MKRFLLLIGAVWVTIAPLWGQGSSCGGHPCLEWDAPLETPGVTVTGYEVCRQPTSSPSTPYVCQRTTNRYLDLQEPAATAWPAGDYWVDVFALAGELYSNSPARVRGLCPAAGDCRQTALVSVAHGRPINVRIEEVVPVVQRPMSRSFDGAKGTYVALTDVPPSGSTWRVEVWFKTDNIALNNSARLIAKWSGDSSQGWPPQGLEWVLIINEGKLLGATFSDRFNMLYGNTTITPNVWHKAALAQQNTTVTLELDGQVDVSLEVNGPPMSTLMPVVLGAGGNLRVMEGHFTGLLAQPRIILPMGVVFAPVDEGPKIRDLISGRELSNNGAAFSNDVPPQEGARRRGNGLLQ